jgi:hypothetical protein
MYLLYIDDSGLSSDKSCQNCVLAGFAIHEAQTYWVQQDGKANRAGRAIKYTNNHKRDSALFAIEARVRAVRVKAGQSSSYNRKQRLTTHLFAPFVFMFSMKRY